MLALLRSINWAFITVVGSAWIVFGLVLGESGVRAVFAFLIPFSAGVFWMNVRNQFE